MRPRALLSFCAAVIATILLGCSSSEPPPPVDYSKLTEDLATTDTAGAISGRVVDTTGNPVNEVQVTVTCTGGRLASGNSFTTWTDSSGWYRIGTMPQGVYLVAVAKPGYVTTTCEVAVVARQVREAPTVTMGASQGGAGSVVVGGGSASIFGKITDASNTSVGIPDAFVYVPFSPSAGRGNQVIALDQSGQDGSYKLEQLPGGTQTIFVKPPSGENYNDMQLSLSVPADEHIQLDITLLPDQYAARVAGIVLTPGSVTVGNSDTQQFTAAVLDYTAQTLSLVPTWVATPALGTVTPDGLLSAVDVPADGYVMAFIGSKVGTAAVAVRPRQIQMPASVDVEATETSKTIPITYTGGGTLRWSVEESVDWLTVYPMSGEGEAQLTLGVNRTGLDPAHAPYTGVLRVTSNGGAQDVSVVCHVSRTDYVIE